MIPTIPHLAPSTLPASFPAHPPTPGGRALRLIGRLALAAGALLSATLGSIAADAESLAQATFSAGTACAGNGFAGTLAAGSTIVHFESCTTAAGAYATVRDASDRLLTEFTVDGKAVVFRIGGVEIGDANTEDDRTRMAEALSSPEARLVAQLLWPKLIEAGYRKTDRSAVAALYANLTAYEFLSAQDGAVEEDCLGCCGNGCTGCMGCYTQLCYQHDSCIRKYGAGMRAHLRCLYLLPAAAASAWECR